MVVSLKTAAVSSLLFLSSFVDGSVVARSPDCDGTEIDGECFVKDPAEFETLSPISQDDFSNLVTRGDGNEPRAFTPVTGVQGSGVIQRLPIGQLRAREPDTFNMLVLALERLMNFPEDRELSWFKLAGIHGLPFEPWQYPDSATANPGLGYCTHSSGIFLTWHRPYLLLIEQMLNSEAIAIANQFPSGQRQKWLNAARRVRYPYWDWAARGTRSRIPAVMKQQRITVTKPQGRVTINNPFFGYRFANGQPPPGSGFGPITTRGPNDQRLQDTFPGRRQSTLDYFSRGRFNPASEHLEGIHGGVHVFIGGDMPIIPRSSFDPLFWLHHANVDRLTAMYQATHPGVTLTPRRRAPTFALGGDGQDDINTPLYPFRHPNGREWTSRDVSDAASIHRYGYAYPDVPAGMSQAELRQFVTQKINQEYGPNTQSQGFSNVESRDLVSSLVSRKEWNAIVEYDTTELNGPSYQINIYLDPIDLSFDANSQSSENLAGACAIFAGMSNPGPIPSGRVSQTVPLTPKLLERGDDLSASFVNPLLTNQLSWTVEKVCPDTGNLIPVPVEDIKSLKVSVVSTTAQYSTDGSELPKKLDELLHLDPTDGKCGGLSSGDPIPTILKGVEGVLDLVGDLVDDTLDGIGDLLD
jgi:tyrosinase